MLETPNYLESGVMGAGEGGVNVLHAGAAGTQSDGGTKAAGGASAGLIKWVIELGINTADLAIDTAGWASL